MTTNHDDDLEAIAERLAKIDDMYQAGGIVDDELAAETDPGHRGWRIGDPVRDGQQQLTEHEAATWLVRRLAALAADQRRIQDQYDRERERLQATIADQLEALDDWHSDLVSGIAANDRWTRDRLMEWQEQRRAAGDKTIKLPSGDLVSRQLPGRLDVFDEDALIVWLREHARQFLQVKVTVKQRELKQALQIDSDGTTIRLDGEQIAGARWVEGGFVYDQKPNDVA